MMWSYVLKIISIYLPNRLLRMGHEQTLAKGYSNAYPILFALFSRHKVTCGTCGPFYLCLRLCRSIFVCLGTSFPLSFVWLSMSLRLHLSWSVACSRLFMSQNGEIQHKSQVALHVLPASFSFSSPLPFPASSAAIPTPCLRCTQIAIASAPIASRLTCCCHCASSWRCRSTP